MRASEQDWRRVVRRVRVYLVGLAVLPTYAGVVGVRAGVVHHSTLLIIGGAFAFLGPVVSGVGWVVVGRVPARDLTLSETQRTRVRWIVAVWSAAVWGGIAAVVGLSDVGPLWVVAVLAAVGAASFATSLFGPWPRG